MKKISAILPQLDLLKIIDVGAMALDDKDPYGELAEITEIEVIGFEPVEAELEKLRNKGQPGRTYLPYAVGDGRRHAFHECNYPMTSSIFEPNMELVNKFQALGEYTQVVNRTELDTVRLDDLPECVGTDYIKVDVQGAELMVLEGGENVVRDAVVVEAEVEFLELYKGQPLFADVDRYMRSQGFMFHRFNPMQGRAMKPLIWKGDVHSGLSQALWSDAIYVRDFMRLDEVPTQKLLKMAVVLHVVYKSIDLASLAFLAADRRDGTDLQPRYLQLLTGKL